MTIEIAMAICKGWRFTVVNPFSDFCSIETAQAVWKGQRLATTSPTPDFCS